MDRPLIYMIAVLGLLTAILQTMAAPMNPAQGERMFGACAACHSLEPDRNMTGPSLAEPWNRKAGTLISFHRYSLALRREKQPVFDMKGAFSDS